MCIYMIIYVYIYICTLYDMVQTHHPWNSSSIYTGFPQPSVLPRWAA